LTQEVGVMDVTAKGARKSGSRLAGSSEPMMACVFGISSGKSYRFVTQTQPISSFPQLRADYDRLLHGLALMELASAVLPHGQPAEDAFAFLLVALSYLEVHENPLICLIWAESKLMEIAGFRPELSRCVVSGGAVRSSPAWVSPHAGGLVNAEDAQRYTDRFQVRGEALIGAARVVELEKPPENLKFAEEVFLLLHRFWLGMADKTLPANSQIADKLRESHANRE
jgi:DNA repair protein RecO (recombination protein O)